MRTGLAALTASMVLVSSPAAFAGFPTPRVTSSHGVGEPFRGSSCWLSATGGGCGDTAWQAPALAADPAGELTIALDGDATELSARFADQNVALTVRPAAPRTYAVMLPEWVAIPAKLLLSIDSDDGTTRYQNSWMLQLVAPTAALVVPDSLTLRGKRLAVAIACPAAAASACSGVLTLRTPSRRIVRMRFDDVGAGAKRTLRTTVRATALRHLTRYRVDRLRAVLTREGGARTVMDVDVRAISGGRRSARARR